MFAPFQRKKLIQNVQIYRKLKTIRINIWQMDTNVMSVTYGAVEKGQRQCVKVCVTDISYSGVLMI